jgi:hypothetical protein
MPAPAQAAAACVWGGGLQGEAHSNMQHLHTELSDVPAVQVSDTSPTSEADLAFAIAACTCSSR